MISITWLCIRGLRLYKHYYTMKSGDPNIGENGLDLRGLTPTYNTCMKMPDVSHQRCDCIGYRFAFHPALVEKLNSPLNQNSSDTNSTTLTAFCLHFVCKIILKGNVIGVLFVSRFFCTFLSLSTERFLKESCWLPALVSPSKTLCYRLCGSIRFVLMAQQRFLSTVF